MVTAAETARQSLSPGMPAGTAASPAAAAPVDAGEFGIKPIWDQE
jgi:hypothetical protein